MMLAAILIGLAPTFAWLFFYLQEDLHPEPKRLIALVFSMGIAAAIVAVFAEVFASELLAYANILPFSLIAITVFAIIEEVAKFGAAYLGVHKNPAFDEPVDAMIYAIVAALGFATIENMGVVGTGMSQAALLGEIFHVTSLRFVGATLLHTLTAGIIGYFWAISIREFGKKSILLLGIILAIGLHVIFNYIILKLGRYGLVYPTIILIITAFFVLYDFEKLKKKNV